MSTAANVVEPPIGLGGAILAEHRHVCAFFNSADEEQRVISPFIREGIERGEKAFHIVDPDLRADYVRRLRDDGLAMDSL
ncbi:MAG: MEDS domain-containing protein, partial [Thermomicrobiales bacterium]